MHHGTFQCTMVHSIWPIARGISTMERVNSSWRHFFQDFNSKALALVFFEKFPKNTVRISYTKWYEILSTVSLPATIKDNFYVTVTYSGIADGEDSCINCRLVVQLCRHRVNFVHRTLTSAVEQLISLITYLHTDHSTDTSFYQSAVLFFL